MDSKYRQEIGGICFGLRSEIAWDTRDAVKILAGGGAKGFGAVGAWADGAEMIVAVDTCGVPVGEADLYGIVADLRGGLCARFGFEHGKNGRGSQGGA
jgi:hypothetical protein